MALHLLRRGTQSHVHQRCTHAWAEEAEEAYLWELEGSSKTTTIKVGHGNAACEPYQHSVYDPSKKTVSYPSCRKLNSTYTSDHSMETVFLLGVWLEDKTVLLSDKLPYNQERYSTELKASLWINKTTANILLSLW